jgi:predicted nucleic acid-binding protein
VALEIADTTALIDHLRGVEHVRDRLARIAREGHEPATTALNVAELYAGLWERERAAAEALIGALRVLPVSGAAARRAGEWWNAYRTQGRTLGLIDAMIAAVAVEHDAVLLTANVADFPMAELTVEALPSRLSSTASNV